jgi:hypothetical protein
MAKTANDEELRKYALKSLKRKEDFRQYMIVYVIVVAITVGVWYLVTPTGYFWPGWVIFGMGIGALFTGLDAWGKLGGKPITTSQIDAEVERLKTKR